MIETWELEYVDGNFTENSLEFPLHDCYHGSSQIFKKHIKTSMNLWVLCMVFNQVLSKLDMQPVPRCRLYAPWAKSPDWGTAHRSFFWKMGTLQESMIVGRKNPTKQNTYLVFIILLYLFSSRLYAYGNKSNSETLELMIDFSKKHRFGGTFGQIILTHSITYLDHWVVHGAYHSCTFKNNGRNIASTGWVIDAIPCLYLTTETANRIFGSQFPFMGTKKPTCLEVF